MNIIEQIEKEQMAAITAKRIVPDFGPGDTVKVMVKVAEEIEAPTKGKAKPKPKDKKGEDKPAFRLQAYEGVVIARDGSGLHESFTVRKISYGEGVERVFPIYSPFIADVEVLRRGRVRRAKLYFLRGRRGKAARILERSDARAKRLAAAFKGTRTRFCVISFSSDWLYPTAESRAIARALNGAAANVSFVEIASDKGHDAFLLDEPDFHRALGGFIAGCAEHAGLP